tara:strand:- start:2241 stop:2396 length:156 start_codon:yes stop_codon:yes gene_type:complete
MSNYERNLLQKAYEQIWVPFFGRILTFFVLWIEGKPLTQKPTYDLREDSDK